MSSLHRVARHRRALLGLAAGCVVATQLAGCGGSDSNPLGNPPLINNPPGVAGQKLSFAYFERCINPIFKLPIAGSTNTCAGSGCHDSANGTGGAFRVIPTAPDVTNLADPPDVIRASDMYKNFYSAQGAVVVGNPLQSRLLTKPRLLNVLHGGGQIFTSDQDPSVKKIEYWIRNPAPAGQDEFSSAGNGLFTPPDPNTGTCNTQ